MSQRLSLWGSRSWDRSSFKEFYWVCVVSSHLEVKEWGLWSGKNWNGVQQGCRPLLSFSEPYIELLLQVHYLSTACLRAFPYVVCLQHKYKDLHCWRRQQQYIRASMWAQNLLLRPQHMGRIRLLYCEHILPAIPIPRLPTIFPTSITHLYL